MFSGALTGGILGSIGTGFGNVLIGIGSSIEALDSLKDLYKTVLKRKQFTTQNSYHTDKITNSLHAYVVINNIVKTDISEAIEWAKLDQPQKQKQANYEYIASNFEVWSEMVRQRGGILGIRPVGMHLKPNDPNNEIQQKISRNPNLPQYLSNNVFMSILKEALDYLNKEADNIVRVTEELTEQEAVQYVARNVMQYLHNEKADLMNTLSRQDQSKGNKIAPKVAIYTSVIYLLKFTDN